MFLRFPAMARRIDAAHHWPQPDYAAAQVEALNNAYTLSKIIGGMRGSIGS
jgi:hypothetical protein